MPTHIEFQSDTNFTLFLQDRRVIECGHEAEFIDISTIGFEPDPDELPDQMIDAARDFGGVIEEAP